jgi:hypothetical protein
MQIQITGNFYNPTVSALSARIYKKIYTDNTIFTAQPEKIFTNISNTSNAPQNDITLYSPDVNVLAPGTYYLYTYLSYTFGSVYKYFSKSYVEFVILEANAYSSLKYTGTVTYTVSQISDFFSAIQNQYTLTSILTFLSSQVNGYEKFIVQANYYSLLDIINMDAYIKDLPADTDATLKNTITDMQKLIKIQYDISGATSEATSGATSEAAYAEKAKLFAELKAKITAMQPILATFVSKITKSLTAS